MLTGHVPPSPPPPGPSCPPGRSAEEPPPLVVASMNGGTSLWPSSCVETAEVLPCFVSGDMKIQEMLNQAQGEFGQGWQKGRATRAEG